MQKLIELKNQRGEKIKALNAIVEAAEKDSARDMSADELSTFNVTRAELTDLDKQIDALETVDLINRQAAAQKEKNTAAHQTVKKGYDMQRSLRNWANNKPQEAPDLQYIIADRELAGVDHLRKTPDNHILYIPTEAMPVYEIQRGGDRFLTRDGRRRIQRAQDVAGTVGLAFIGQDQMIDIVQSPPLYMSMGVRVYNGLVGDFNLPNASQNVAAFVAEKAALPAAATSGKATLTPRRVGVSDLWTAESLAKMTAAVLGDFLADMNAAIDRAITLECITAADALAETNAFTDATFANIIGMTTAIENFENATFAAHRSLEGNLKALAKDAGSGQMVWTEGNTMAGYNAIGTFLWPAGNELHLIFGDWSNGVNVGFWGGMEIIRDPFSASDTGEERISVFRIADAKVRNSARFAVSKSIATVGGAAPVATIAKAKAAKQNK